jgi:hypothetical protein
MQRVDKNNDSSLIVTLTLSDNAAPFSLSVTGGSGSGNYVAGSTVYISANPTDDTDPSRAVTEPGDVLAPEQMFDRWIGDTGAR